MKNDNSRYPATRKSTHDHIQVDFKQKNTHSIDFHFGIMQKGTDTTKKMIQNIAMSKLCK